MSESLTIAWSQTTVVHTAGGPGQVPLWKAVGRGDAHALPRNSRVALCGRIVSSPPDEHRQRWSLLRDRPACDTCARLAEDNKFLSLLGCER